MTNTEAKRLSELEDLDTDGCLTEDEYAELRELLNKENAAFVAAALAA